MKDEIISAVTKEIIDQILELLKDDVYKIYLYGSYAREDFTVESDIDIMILLNCDKEKIRSYRKQISILASRIGLKNDVEVSLLLRDRESFEQDQDILPFYRNVVNEGVELYRQRDN